jgi:hypothetical protein
MSHEMTAAVWTRLGVSGGRAMLALALADHADPDGTSIFPSVHTLAWYTRQDPRTVQRQLRWLVRSGWLELVRERVPRFQSREYRISPVWVGGGNLPGLPDRKSREQSVDKSKAKASPMPAPPALDARRGDTAMSPNSSGSVITHNSSFNDSDTEGSARRRTHAIVNGLAAMKAKRSR